MAKVFIKVSGKVQGVFYRQFVRDVAKGLNVKAVDAQNLPDGAVEVIAEGPEETLEKLVEACRRGSPLSKVEKIEINWEHY